jgi:hypothetical protein
MSSKNVNSFSTIDTVNTYSNSSLLGIVSGNLTRLTSGNLVLNKVNASNLIYNTGNQIKAGRLIIGDDEGSIVDPNTQYTLSLQTNSPVTWLEILNYSGANQGVFFGIQDNNFEQYNWQGGDIIFYTAENPSQGINRLAIKNDGKVGIGINSPSEKLEVVGNIKASGAMKFNGGAYISGYGIDGGVAAEGGLLITSPSIGGSTDLDIIQGPGSIKLRNDYFINITHNSDINLTTSKSSINLRDFEGDIYLNGITTAKTGTFEKIYASNLVYNTGNQTIFGNKTFNGNTIINNLVVTGTETIVNTSVLNIANPYLLLNISGGATDGGIFFVTGVGLTGINDSGPIIGFDHSNKFKFGISTRNSDLSPLPDIASVQEIRAYSGVADNKFATITNLATTGSTLDSKINTLSGSAVLTYGNQNINGIKNFSSTPTVNNTGVLLQGQNSFIITLYNTSDTQAAGHNYFGNMANSMNGAADGANRRFPVLESCVVRRASWTQFNTTIGNPSLNSTGYFINTTTSKTGIISTTINTQSTSAPTHYTAEFSPPIAISTGDYIVCSLFGPTYATTFPAGQRNTVNIYCYN